MSDPIVYRAKSRTMFLDGAAALDGGMTPQEAVKQHRQFKNPEGDTQDVMADVAQWGSNNTLPQDMLADIEKTSVLQAAIDAKARIAVGKGPMPAIITGINSEGYEELEFIADAEILDWLEMNQAFEYSYATTKDLIGLGNAFSQILLSADRSRLLAFRRHDASEVRFAKRNTYGCVEKVYLSGDWRNYASPSAGGSHYATLPMLDMHLPLIDLQSRTSGYAFMVAMQYPLMGRKYYSPAPWFAARKWVQIAQSIPEMKQAMFSNQMSIKYVVEIHTQFWEKRDPRWGNYTAEQKMKEKNDFFDAIEEKLVGNDKAYKSIFTENWAGGDGEVIKGITITTLDDKIKDGKLLPDGATAEAEIMFSLMMNPALLGVDVPGGGAVRTAGSGSNIREAYLVQVMMMEAERRMNSTIFNLAKKMNGWQERLGKDKPLVLRFPNQILTTLNTGKNTQPTA